MLKEQCPDRFIVFFFRFKYISLVSAVILSNIVQR